MDTQALSLLSLMQESSSIAPEIIAGGLSQLKADVKHKTVPHAAIAPIFDVVRLALDSAEYLDAGLSTLSHLAKRLVQQRQLPFLESQIRRTTPLLFDILSHEKERLRSRAGQALVELYSISSAIANNVESMITDAGLRSGSTRTVEAASQLIVKLYQAHVYRAHRIRNLVQPLISCLYHGELGIRTAAKDALVQLYIDADEQEKEDLKLKLQGRKGLEVIANEIKFQIDSTQNSHTASTRSADPKPLIASTSTGHSASTRSTGLHNQTTGVRPTKKSEAPSHNMTIPQIADPQEPSTMTSSLPSKSTQDSVVQPLPYLPEPSTAELEAMKIDPIYVESARDVDQLFAEMHPYFEGKEAESNWMQREQSALKIRRITRGNAPEEFLPQYTAGIKHLLDGLVKGCTSLRTTLSTTTCHCVQDVSRQLKQGLDPMVEVLLQCLLKLCANTKKLTAASGNACVAELISCVTFTGRIGQHLVNATKDKNVQPRLFATKWTMIVLTRYGRQRSHLDAHVECLTTAITNGLNDRDKDVREAMRPTFWAYARLWNDRSKNILSKLDKKQQDLLLGDKANPFSENWFAAPSSAPSVPAKLSSTKPSVKDAIAQQRAMKKTPLDRPGSAADIPTPAKDVSAGVPARPKSALLTSRRPGLASSIGSMSSAPVRPLRPPQKTGPFRVVPNETPAARTARIHEESQMPPRTPKEPRKAPIVPALLSRPNKTPAKGSTKVPIAVTDEPKSTSQPLQTSTESTSDGTVLPLATAATAKGSNRTAVIVDPGSTSAPSEIFSAPTVGSAASEDTIATNPNAIKRASWSSDETPLEFDKDRPPHDVGLASMRKLSADGLDTSQRVPVRKDSVGPVGQNSIALGNTTVNNLNRQMLWGLPDESPATLAVEPFGPPVSEASHLSVGGNCSVPVPQAAEQRSEHDTRTRLSHSPRPHASRKEGLKTTNDIRTPLRVYEDDKESVDLWLEVAMEDPTTAPHMNNRVLGELPVNTDMPKRGNSFSAKTNAEDNVAMYRTRQLLERSIPRISEGTFDEDGYRKLRSLVTKNSTWATGVDGRAIFDELVLSVQSVLQGNGSYAGKGFEQLHPLRSQVIHLLESLSEMSKMDLDRWSIQLVRSLIIARDDYPNVTRMGMSINILAKRLAIHHDCESTILQIMHQLTPDPSAVSKSHALQPHSVYMALELIVATLRGNAPKLDQEMEVKLGALATRCLGDLDADIRMGALDLAIVMWEVVKPESRYWELMVGMDMEHHDLLLYYLAKSAPLASKEGQGSEELLS